MLSSQAICEMSGHGRQLSSPRMSVSRPARLVIEFGCSLNGLDPGPTLGQRSLSLSHDTRNNVSDGLDAAYQGGRGASVERPGFPIAIHRLPGRCHVVSQHRPPVGKGANTFALVGAGTRWRAPCRFPTSKGGVSKHPMRRVRPTSIEQGSLNNICEARTCDLLLVTSMVAAL